MKETKTIEQQVAELTEEQKQTILKVDKYGMIILLVLTVPGLLFMMAGVFFLMTTASALHQDTYNWVLIAGGVVLAVSLSMFLFIRFRYPYYSDKKCSYLRKQQKLAKKAASTTSKEG